MRRYEPGRNYGCRTTEYIYRGLRSIALENDLLRIVVLADKGTDIFEFLYKPLDVDFMWRSPWGVRDPATFVPTTPRPDGAFLDYYEGGWQEVLPTGDTPCTYLGASYGGLGEVALLPWDYQLVYDSPEQITVLFSVRTYRSPFRVEKRLSLRRGIATLYIDERVTNEGQVPLDFMWGHHPCFGAPFLDEHCRIDAPEADLIVLEGGSTSRLQPGEGQRWPWAAGRDGRQVDLSAVQTREQRVHNLAVLTGLREGWCSVTNTRAGVGIGLGWQLEVFPYVVLWQAYGGMLGEPWYGRNYCLALEPWSSHPQSLPEAVATGTSLHLAPGESLSSRLAASVHTGSDRVARVHPDGTVERCPAP